MGAVAQRRLTAPLTKAGALATSEGGLAAGAMAGLVVTGGPFELRHGPPVGRIPAGRNDVRGLSVFAGAP